jgi:hypothetical protein
LNADTSITERFGRRTQDAGWDSLTPTVRDVVRQAYDRAHVPAIDALALLPDVLAAVATEPAGICMFQ